MNVERYTMSAYRVIRPERDRHVLRGCALACRHCKGHNSADKALSAEGSANSRRQPGHAEIDRTEPE